MDAANKLFLEILEKRGVMFDEKGKIVRIPGFTGADALTDAQIRFTNERRPSYETESFLRVRWAEQLAELVDVLIAQGSAAPWPHRSMFWIRLHGILWDLRQTALEGFRVLQIDPLTYAPPPNNALVLELQKFRCIEAIRKLFTDDELIYSDYIRQSNGHPTQGQYEVRWSQANGGQVNDRRRVVTIGREFTSAELDAAVRRVLMAHVINGIPDERVIATEFATRIRPVLAALVLAMQVANTEI